MVASRVIVSLLAGLADGPVYWDIPDGNIAARTLAERCGFTPQRPLLRMFRGSNVGSGNVAQYYALADPAIG